jgi:hypothetical protein
VIINNDAFVASFGIVPEGDDDELVRIVRNAVRRGFAIVPIAPGKKDPPLCTLTARQAKAADMVAQEAARDAGRPHWNGVKHDCGLYHAMTDSEKAARVIRRLATGGRQLNLAIHVGLSRMVLVDTDTTAEKAGFLAEWSTESGNDMAGRQPTVTTPGVRKVTADGEEQWIHKDGGHFWFTVPEGIDLISLPGNGEYTSEETGWTAKWKNSYALVPPSVREEGAYAITGQVEPVPPWLLKRIHETSQTSVKRHARQRDHIDREGDPIQIWSAATPWAELLKLDGWVNTNQQYKCGCQNWLRPGDPASKKSSTAHELGCAEERSKLHIWTDNPPDFLVGHKDVTKLTYYALCHHNGNHVAAMRDLGIKRLSPEQADVDMMLDGLTPTAAMTLPTSVTPLDTEFWSARPCLKHIHDALHARQRSAPAGLGVVLARVAAMVSHRLRIPPIVGSASGLSLLVAILAPPGVGKTSANTVGTELLPVPAGLDMPDQMPLGSGEGLIEAFFDLVEEENDKGKVVKIKRQVRHNAFVFVDEGQVLSEIGNRRGATLLPTLRSVFSGSTLGQQNASAERRRVLLGGRYTMGFVIALQPGLAGAVLDDAAGGTPQRLLWLPATDSTIPDAPPEWPGRLSWTPPELARPISEGGQLEMDLLTADSHESVDFRVAESICKEIRTEDLARARGQTVTSELDAHAGLVQLKVATLLGLLDGRLDVNEEDWQLARVIRQASDLTRSAVEHTVAAAAAEKVNQRVRSLADQAVTQDVAITKRRVIETSQWIGKKVWTDPDRWTAHQLRQASDSRKRAVFTDALEHAEAEDWVVVTSEPGQGTAKRCVRPGKVDPR